MTLYDTPQLRQGISFGVRQNTTHWAPLHYTHSVHWPETLLHFRLAYVREVQLTPASSEWTQLCIPKPLLAQSVNLVSVPTQFTLSNQIVPVPWPNAARERATASGMVLQTMTGWLCDDHFLRKYESEHMNDYSKYNIMSQYRFNVVIQVIKIPTKLMWEILVAVYYYDHPLIQKRKSW